MKRALPLALVGLVLVVGLTAQAISSVLTNRNPEIARQALPSNGGALQAQLRLDLAQQASDESQLPALAASLLPRAQEAFARDPLGPTALAIAILGTEDEQAKQALIEAASQINRRDLLLQGVTLDAYLRQEDIEGAFVTLDRMLRVHPERREMMFPVLAQSLQQDAALPVLAEILDGSSEWHSQFYDFAVRDGSNALPLARLRLAGGEFSPQFDQILLRGLVQRGDFDVASAVYRDVTGASSRVVANGVVDWETRLAPFDWEFSDEGGFRAQTSPDGSEMEIFVRGGKGGIIAERMIDPIEAPFTIAIEHSLGPAAQVRDVRLVLRCIDSDQPFIDERFVSGRTEISITDVPAPCEFIMMGINARSWSGQPPLAGSISEISINP